MKWRMIDLFSGVAGFSLAASWVWGSNLEIKCFVEKDKSCRKVLKKNFPEVRIIKDVKDFPYEEYGPGSTDIVCGGDPCPVRSRARSNGASVHPDLSGYFLAVVGRCRPKWVVRENVPAPDDVDFTTCLDLLGYRTVIVRADAAAFTGQRRIRDFIVGCREEAGIGKLIELCEPCDSARYHSPRLGTQQVIPCLTTHRSRYDSRDCYVFDGRLRVLDGDERQTFAGFPKDWITGVSEAGVAKMTGNAVCPQVAVQIMRAIKETDERRR